MAKVDASRYGQARPKLEQDDLEGDFTILTVETFEEVKTDDGPRPVMTFRETGEKSLWLNVSQVKTLIAHYGDESNRWIGKTVPIEKHTAEFRGEKFEKVRIMPAEDWQQAYKDAGEKFQGDASIGTAKPAPKPQGKRKAGGRR